MCPAILTDAILHGLVLAHGALGQLLPKKQRFGQVRRRIPEQRLDILFAQGFDFHSVLCQPGFHLSHGIGIFQSRQRLHLLCQLG